MDAQHTKSLEIARRTMATGTEDQLQICCRGHGRAIRISPGHILAATKADAAQIANLQISPPTALVLTMRRLAPANSRFLRSRLRDGNRPSRWPAILRRQRNWLAFSDEQRRESMTSFATERPGCFGRGPASSSRKSSRSAQTNLLLSKNTVIFGRASAKVGSKPVSHTCDAPATTRTTGVGVNGVPATVFGALGVARGLLRDRRPRGRADFA